MKLHLNVLFTVHVKLLLLCYIYFFKCSFSAIFMNDHLFSTVSTRKTSQTIFYHYNLKHLSEWPCFLYKERDSSGHGVRELSCLKKSLLKLPLKVECSDESNKLEQGRVTKKIIVIQASLYDGLNQSGYLTQTQATWAGVILSGRDSTEMNLIVAIKEKKRKKERKVREVKITEHSMKKVERWPIKIKWLAETDLIFDSS